MLAGIAGIGCQVPMVLDWQLNIVCAVIRGCSHLLFIAATTSAHAILLGIPHNTVHLSSDHLKRSAGKNAKRSCAADIFVHPGV